LINKPLNLIDNDKYKRIVELKKNFHSSMKNSIYYNDKSQFEKSNFNAIIQKYKYSNTKAAAAESSHKWEPGE
jgi:hypothetical protein